MKGQDMRSILLVDDDESLTEVLSDNFSEMGLEIQRACYGQEALEKMSRTQFDAILLDVMMPDMDGLELLCEMNKRMILSPVVMLTGYPQPSIILKALRLGAMDFIEKPCAMAELRDVLRRAIEIGVRIKAYERELDEIALSLPKDAAQKFQRLRDIHRVISLWKQANFSSQSG